MAKHKHTSKASAAIIAATLVITILFMMGQSFGITAAHAAPPYAEKLFSTDRVHTLDIVVSDDDWDEMLQNAMAEEYIMCDVVIDGDAVKNVAIRPKGNSSLSSIAGSDSDRYSFKIEFDHYNGAQTYYGLDKLALNNIAQDNTYLKDYVSYRMMSAFGADAPLCSFIYITVNGEDWGLYLAAEGIEEAFAKRLYGADYGEIYKPDTTSMNIGGGNNPAGRDNAELPRQDGGQMPQLPDDWQVPEDWQMPEEREMPEGMQIPDGMQMPDGFQMPEGQQAPEENQMPQAPEVQQTPGSAQTQNGQERQARPDGSFGGAAGRFGGGFGGTGSNSAVTLSYSGDDPDSYSAIFDNAAFNPTDADKSRLIASLKRLSEGGELDSVVDVDEVLRYFVVHNFVLNFDSYTGSIIHNYYLYEKDGVLRMIAWDYNLAFGAFGMGMGDIGGMGMGDSSGADSATAYVNFPIDTPVSGGTQESRPLLDKLLSNDEYLARYHELFSEFIGEYFDNGEFERMLDDTVALILPYVERDPTAFCTYEEFVTASASLREFCLLRADSVAGQLGGTIAATSEGQTASENAGFIDASHIDFDSMGSAMSGFGRVRGGNIWQGGRASAG